MQSSSEQPLVGEERYVTTLTTAAKETSKRVAKLIFFGNPLDDKGHILIT